MPHLAPDGSPVPWSDGQEEASGFQVTVSRQLPRLPIHSPVTRRGSVHTLQPPEPGIHVTEVLLLCPWRTSGLSQHNKTNSAT